MIFFFNKQDLYPRLYSLLTPQSVGSRDRAQFFTLLDAALASRMVCASFFLFFREREKRGRDEREG